MQQVIAAADGLRRGTYTSFRDSNGAVSERFTQETRLTASQVQAMWNEVCQQKLLEHAAFGVNWLSGADLYQENTNIIQIRANGSTSNYRRVNGYPAATRPLMLLVQGVRLPITQGVDTPVAGAATQGASRP